MGKRGTVPALPAPDSLVRESHVSRFLAHCTKILQLHLDGKGGKGSHFVSCHLESFHYSTQTSQTLHLNALVSFHILSNKQTCHF